MSDENKIVLRSFSNLKNFETKIYRAGNINLLVPIGLESTAIFTVVLLMVFFIDKFFSLPIMPVIKFVAIPVGLTMFIRTAKVDGKKPYIYLLRLIQYISIKDKVIERFEFREEEKEIEFY